MAGRIRLMHKWGPTFHRTPRVASPSNVRASLESNCIPFVRSRAHIIRPINLLVRGMCQARCVTLPGTVEGSMALIWVRDRDTQCPQSIKIVTHNGSTLNSRYETCKKVAMSETWECRSGHVETKNSLDMVLRVYPFFLAPSSLTIGNEYLRIYGRQGLRKRS